MGTAAAAILVGAPLAAVAAPASASTGWTPTATQGLSLKNAVAQGSAPAGAPMRITVALKPADKTGLDNLIKAQNTPGNAAYHSYLTPAQFNARFAPSTAATSAVANYLASQGFTNISTAANRLSVTADGTAASAQKAFNTSLGQFAQAGRTVLANLTPAQIPAGLANTVSAVLGLNTISMTTPHVVAAAGSPSLNGFYPKQFQTIYHAGSTKTGSATNIAVITEGDMTQTLKDLRTAESKQNLPQVPVTVVRTGPASSDTAGTDEWDLDTQTSTGVAQTVKHLYLYDATTLDDADLYRAISRFASDHIAKVGSASLGECDVQAYLDGALVSDDTVLEQAAVQGQTFFASSGDTGASCPVAPTNGVPLSGPIDTSYPASSPYVVGVGGTTLLADSNGNYINEISWNAGGGGVSPVEIPGPWTANADPAYPASSVSILGSGRGVPDVAADADANTGAQIYVNGQPEVIGGTSLSSPLWLGVMARLESSHGNGIGFAAPLFYKLYDKANPSGSTSTVATPGFHDIQLGTNGLYPATPGYDFNTGIGTPDIAALSANL